MPGRRDRAAAGLRAALRWHPQAVRIVRRRFAAELAALTELAEAGATGVDELASAFDDEAWTITLADIWVMVGADVYQRKVDELMGGEGKQIRQVVALVQQIVRYGRPAEQITRFLEEQAAGIITTSRRRVHTVLREAGSPSEVREVTRALRRLYRTEFVKVRANRIALDQVLRAVSVFEQAAAEQVQASTGREYVKVWVTQGDDRVRADHAEADGQTVPLSEPFKVGLTLLRYPRDPAGPASQTVNCRCWAEHRVVRPPKVFTPNLSARYGGP